MTVYRVTLNQVMYSQSIINVLHFRHASSDPLEMQNLANEVETGWINFWRVRQVTNLVYSRIKVQMLQSQFAPFEKVISLAGGLGGSDEFKVFLCHIVRLRTATAGRQGRGRIYLAGPFPSAAQFGIIRPEHMNTYQNVINNVMGVFGPTGSSAFRLVVHPHAANGIPKDVISLSIAPLESVQRRRNIGVGS